MNDPILDTKFKTDSTPQAPRTVHLTVILPAKFPEPSIGNSSTSTEVELTGESREEL